jgi:hypothetical protein
VGPLTRGLLPPDLRSLCPLSSTEFIEPPKKFLGTSLCRNAVMCTLGSACVFFEAIVSKTRRSVFTARYEINIEYIWATFLFPMSATFRLLVACRSPRKPVSTPGHSLWYSWWTRCQLNRPFSECFSFPCQYLSTNAPYSLSLTCCFKEEKVSVTWEPSKKQFSFGNPGIMDRRYFHFSSPQQVQRILADPCLKSRMKFTCRST